VNVRNVLVVSGCFVNMVVGARRERRVMKVRMGEESEVILAGEDCSCYRVLYVYMYHWRWYSI
jgi:predicted nucleic acid-binding Zn finger protein